MKSMKKMRTPIRRAPLLILVAVLLAVPLLVIACSDDEKKAIEAKFSASATTGVAPVEIQFTDESTSTGDVTEWLWDFGDGTTTSAEQNPTHTYADVGLYTVILEVSGSEGSDTEAKARYISVTAVVYPKMTLTLSTAVSGTDPAYVAAQEFADLLEGYTGGNVQVLVYPGGTLYTPQEEFGMVKIGAADITWISPVLLRMFGLGQSLDPFTSIDRMIPSITIARAMVEDGRVMQIVDELLEALDIKFLGATDSTLMGGLFSTARELTDISGFEGLKFASNYPGVQDPWHEYAGFESIYVPFADRSAAVTLGTINTVTAGLSLAKNQGYGDLFDHAFAWTAYSPYYGLMNLETWNGLGAEIQDLITNTIMPEVVALSQDYAIKAAKMDMRYLIDDMETFNFETPAESAAIYDAILENAKTQAILAKIDPEMLSIIEDLLPATFEMDPLIQEILDYVGVTVE